MDDEKLADIILNEILDTCIDLFTPEGKHWGGQLQVLDAVITGIMKSKKFTQRKE